ncbi:MAG: 5'-methylthioadenosine/adenosylhomocysteine nucleosidase [Pseudomonadales bacterium]|nr:5'-methylthioadenosine/adenosylhomocysteine nucleosidase [Pseudomonadales bacterium]
MKLHTKVGHVALIVSLLLSVAIASSSSQAQQSNAIGILTALDIELDLLIGAAETIETTTIGGVEYHRARLNSVDVVLARAGAYGMLPSATTSILIHEFGVSGIVFTGIAGGVADHTKVLDVVISTDLIIHDCGTQTDDGFVWKPDCGVKEDGSIPVDPYLRKIASDAAKQIVGKEHVFEGRIVSGEAFIASQQYVNFLRDQFDAYAVESEGGPVARIAHEFGVPVIVIRTLSDKADGRAHDSYASFAQDAADNSARVVLKMLIDLAGAERLK